MFQLPKSIEDAVKSFTRISGVGEKTALRQVMSIIKWDQEFLEEFSRSISQLAKIKSCTECGLYTDDDICHICNESERVNNSVLCVVENISDLMAIEKSGEFKGIYHVLGGVLNPLMGIGPNELKIDHLVNRVQKFDTKNVILAVNPSVEGDATCSYIKQLLKGIHVERIGFGVPIGGSLEYLDPLTISKALENRKQL